MSDQNTRGGFAGDPADALAVAGTSGCCGNPARATLTLPEPAPLTLPEPAPLTLPEPAPLTLPEPAPCCGTAAEAAAEGSCCGSSAKADAAAAGQGCCG
ncbi:hypothetical protein ACFY36_50855 [Actinoplanes sp. NPDC000266]